MNLLTESFERLCKWRIVLAGWQLGTRPIGDAEADAVRDHREATLMLRAELSALTGLLISRHVITADEFARATAEECERYMQRLEDEFPGFHAVDDGMVADERTADTCRNWPK